MKKKIGIMGGTFNPIHIGHLILAENAYALANLDEVWFMPTGVSYLKDQREIVSAEHRVNMVNLAIEGNPHFKISKYEIEAQGNTYTYKTLLGLRELYCDCDFYFIMGEDSLEYITSWVKPEIIFDNCTIIAAPRNSDNPINIHDISISLREQHHAKIIELDVSVLDISSHMIRDRIAKGISSKYYLPSKVEDYIKTNNLYIK